MRTYYPKMAHEPIYPNFSPYPTLTLYQDISCITWVHIPLCQPLGRMVRSRWPPWVLSCLWTTLLVLYASYTSSMCGGRKARKRGVYWR